METITEISDAEIVTERVLVPEALIDIVELGDDESLASLVAIRVTPRVSISSLNGMAMDLDPSSGPQRGTSAMASSRTFSSAPSSKTRPHDSRAFALGFAFLVVGLALGAGTGLAATGAAALLARPAPPPEELVFGASSLPPSFPPPLPLVRSPGLEYEVPGTLSALISAEERARAQK